ncbi:MAG: AIR carboxylase family protein [Chloroflexota bacterium]
MPIPTRESWPGLRCCPSSRCHGVPVATVAIGNATNAGLLAAAILALGDADLAARLAARRAEQTRMVLDDPSNEVPLA